MMRSRCFPSFAITFLLTLFVTLVAGTSHADEGDAARDGRRQGWGPGVWGMIPAPHDSVRAAFTNRTVPAWERAVNLPHDAARLVLWPVLTGTSTGVIFFDEHADLGIIRKIVSPRIGPFDVTLNFQAGGLVGPAAGFTARSEDRILPESKVKIGVRFARNASNKATFGFRKQLGDDEAELGFGYRAQPNARYFGLGARAPEQNESRYTHEAAWVGVSYGKALPAGLTAEGFTHFSGVGASGPSEDESPKLDAVFAAALPTGWRDRSDGVTVGLALVQNTTAETGRPQSGGLRRLAISWFTSTDGPQSHFLTWRAEVQQFLPLWFSKRSLAVRAFATRLEPSGDDPIPFQRLITNDDPDLFRGYDDFRWRDRGMVAASVEYRWPIWALTDAEGMGLDAYLLADVGQVFGEFQEVAWDDLTASIGFGVRFVAPDASFAGRLDTGRSEESSVTRLRGDQMYQYEKGGFYYGRSPVPTR